MNDQLPDTGSFWDKHLTKLLLLGLLLLAFGLRILGLWGGKNFDVSRQTVTETVKIQQVVAAVSFQNPSFLRIEGSRYNLPIGMVHKKNDPLYESILPAYLLTPVYSLFGFDFGKIVYFYAFIGALCVLAVFWLARLVYSTKIAFGASALYLFNFWMSVSSHLILNLAFTPLLVCLAMGFLIKILKGEMGVRNWLGMAVFYGLAVQFQVVTLLLLPLFPILLIFGKRTVFLSLGKNLLVLAAFVLTMALPLIAEIRSGFEQTLAWFTYIPKMLGTNVLDLYKDFFISIGKNITVFVLPTVATNEWIKWLAGLLFVAFLIYRLVILKKRGGMRESFEAAIVIILMWFCLVSYVNYVSYFKNQIFDLTVIKSMAFFWPVFAVFVSSFISFERKGIKFPLGIIAGFLMLMNIYVWFKNLDYTDVLGINYDTRIKITDVVSSTKQNTRHNIELDIFDSDPTVFAFLSLYRHAVPPASVNGVKLDIQNIDLKNQNLLINYLFDQNIVSTMTRDGKGAGVFRQTKQSEKLLPGTNYLVTDKEYMGEGKIVKTLGKVKIIQK